MRHYEALRRLYNESTLLYIMENNLGKEHDNLKGLIMDKTIFDNNVDFLYENNRVVGFHTGPNSKTDACHLARQIISLGCMVFAENFLTINPDAVGGPAGMKALLLEQIGNLREFSVEKINGQFKHSISGKHDERGLELKGRKDDAQMACFMAILYSQRFLNDDLPVNMEVIQNRIYKRRYKEEEPNFVDQALKRRKIEISEQQKQASAAPLFSKARVDPNKK